MAKTMNVKVENLSALADAPGWLEHSQRHFLDRATQRIGDEVRKRAPGGPGGHAGRDVEARTLSSTRAVVQSRGWIGAKTLELGAVIRPHGKALRLRNGRFVHRSTRRRRGSAGAPPGAVFVPGKHYYKRGLRARGKIIREEFGHAFGDIRRPV